MNDRSSYPHDALATREPDRTDEPAAAEVTTDAGEAAGAITDEGLRRAAAKHGVCVHTVLRALVGLPIKGSAGERARRASEMLREERRSA